MSPYRPILQGDVFTEVEIGGLGVQDAIIIVSHPCTMRAGVALKPRLQAAKVRQDSQLVDLDEWPTGHFRSMLLPGLDPDSADHFSAALSEVGIVHSSDLRLDRRKACLSELGIYLLQQRMVFCQTRALIGLDTLAGASQHVLEEAELLEEWIEGLVSEDGQGLTQAITSAAEEFDTFLSEPAAASLRSKLELSRECAGVRRAVRTEIDRRRSA